ncbi:MAG: tRNA (adenosine(37)-N6)-dimethylallyltransferase MiaA [Legionellales bacterium]|nr:MAG: tRNA (adenosine(37)-N6)-dimethylallyltransferase MiaA [Legionellales bacterium]
MHNQIICLMGPTASGKTALAIQIASQQDVEIISVDSAMVYRGMDIGTGKPTAAELQLAPHHLIDICDPSTAYSVANFCNDVTVLIEKSFALGRTPLLVGGTMMYFKALQQGLAVMPEADPVVRQEILDAANATSWQELHKQLHIVDPISAKNIRNTDTQRIQRALEVYKITGKPMSKLIAAQEPADLAMQYEFINIAIDLPRSTLHARIAQRWQNMLQQGVIEEVAALYARDDLTVDLPALRSVGYRQIWHYLAGEYGKDLLQEKVLAATRQLGKRQCTWLRSWPKLKLLDGNCENKYLAYCKLMLD